MSKSLLDTIIFHLKSGCFNRRIISNFQKVKRAAVAQSSNATNLYLIHTNKTCLVKPGLRKWKSATDN